MDNKYRNFDKGMDDAYMGIEPSDEQSKQYMEGYEYSEYLLQQAAENMQGFYNQIQEICDDYKNPNEQTRDEQIRS